MKKTITSLLLLMMGVFLGSAYAADLTIGDVDVTTSNASNIKPSGLKSGKISYDFDTKVLTLKDVTYSSTQKISFVSSLVENLDIHIDGDCNITTAGPGFRIQRNAIIRAAHKYETLNVSSTSSAYQGLKVLSGARVNVYWLNMVVSADYPVVGDNGNESVYFSCSTLYAKSTGTNAAVSKFASFLVNDVDFSDSHYKYDTSKRAVVDASGNVLKTVSVVADLKVGNEIVNISAGSTYTLVPAATGVTSGSITYAPSTKTLTYTSVTQTTAPKCIDNLSVDGLTVKFVGTNMLTSTSSDGVRVSGTTKFEGTSPTESTVTLHAKTDNGSYWGLWLENGTKLSMTNMTFAVSAYKYPVCGQGSSCSLNIDKCNILAADRSGEGRAISNIYSCTMNGSDVKSPTGCCYRTSLNGFGTASALSSGTVQIATVSTYYPVWIFGKQLNNINSRAFDGLTAGSISYNSSTKTLTLNRATLKSPSGNSNSAIYVNGANINVIDTTKVTSVGNCLAFNNSVKVTGTGYIEGTSSEQSGVSGYGYSKLTVSNYQRFRFVGKKYGYWGAGTDTLRLEKNGNHYYYKGFNGEVASVYNLGTLELSDYDVDGEFYYKDKNFYRNGGELAKNVYVDFRPIYEKYNIWVAGKQVNRLYSSESRLIYVGSPYIKSGYVYYNPSTNTLTLNKADINYTGTEKAAAIYNSSTDNITISLYGENKIETTQAGAIYCLGGNSSKKVTTTISGTISGTGSLTAKGKSSGIRVYTYNDLVISGTTVSFEGGSWGLDANYSQPDNNSVTIKNGAAVKAIGNSYAVENFSSINLSSDIKVSQPSGAVVKTNPNKNNAYTVFSSATSTDRPTTVVFSNGKSVFDSKKGDVDRDGNISMSDANAIVTYYLATNKSSITNFDVNAADINNDGNITMSDANDVVTLFLEGSNQ